MCDLTQAIEHGLKIREDPDMSAFSTGSLAAGTIIKQLDSTLDDEGQKWIRHYKGWSMVGGGGWKTFLVKVDTRL